MFRIHTVRLLFVALLIPLCCSSVQAAEKTTPTMETTGSSVVHTFASQNELKQFVTLFNAKGATNNRIMMT